MMRRLHDALHVMDFPLKMPGGVQLGTRTTLVRLDDSSLFAHSPGPASEADFDEVDTLGPVAHVIAPNLFHHFSIPDWVARYPNAKLWGPPGLEAKLEGSATGLHFATLGDDAPAVWAGQIDQVAIQGAPKMNEIAFVHRASRTLLLTDLCFNIRHSDSLLTRLFMRANDCYGRFGPSRMARSLMMKDHTAVKASVERILALDFDRATVTHGDVLETDAKQGLRQAFAAIG